MPRHSAKKQPIRNSMNLTTSEYNEFISNFGFTNTYLKKWLNDVVLREGVKFPFDMEELYTYLKFSEGALHLMMEVEKGYEHFLDDVLMDEVDAA